MLHNTKISIIAAIGKNRELGKDNKLLWHIPEDLKRFRQLTSGHSVIMGRKTFESIGRPLPNRLNIVITRDKSFKCHSELVSESSDRSRNKFGMTKCLVTHSLEEALIHATNYNLRTTEDEVFIIGGGQIFEQAMPIADRLYLTIVDASFDADVYFPDHSMFTKIISEQKGESGGYTYAFLELEK